MNTNDVQSKVNRLTTLFRNLDRATNQVGSSNRVNAQLTQSQTKVQNIASRVRQWAANQSQVTSHARATNNVLRSIGSRLSSIAYTYLGIMGAKAAIDTTDTFIGAKNRLNYVSSDILGKEKGFDSSGNYSSATLQMTADAMDKMYASSQRVRTSYTDMIGNVSKTMSLAGGAFKGNIDNAIRFQEIMAEAYTLGGATAQEQSGSMYQLTQALGAGILAGDELRSVREGAPLAYQEIERFAQATLGTTDSLKDLASQGKITSDIVVAAIMAAGDKMDTAFQQTEVTFGQFWDMVKNTAVYAFKPVMDVLANMLQKLTTNDAIQKMETFFLNVAKVFLITFQLISNAINWFAENWNWLKNVVIAALSVMIAYFLVTKAVAIASAIASAADWVRANWPLVLIVATLAIIIYAFYQVTQGALTMANFLVICAFVIAAAFIIAGIIMGSVPMIIIGAIIALLAVIFLFFEQVCYGAAWLAAWIVNIVFGIANVVTAIFTAIAVVFQWIIAFIVNLVCALDQSISAVGNNILAGVVNVAMGIWNVICAVCQNIGIAFANAWNGAMSAFWNFIADCIDGLSWLMQPLAAIAELFGKSFDAKSFSAGIRSKAGGYAQQDYVSISDAWSSGMSTMGYQSVGDAWSDGWNTMAFANMGNSLNSAMNVHSYVDANAWGSAAGDWGAGVKDSINDWGSQFQLDGSNKLTLDNIGNSLGLDLSSLNGAFPHDNNLMVDDFDVAKNIADTANNTGAMADSMDLADEELEYLRKIAEMEWKKEFTTANITVDMTNYNTVEGDGDLDGILVKLSDRLVEEMQTLPNGVYAGYGG